MNKIYPLFPTSLIGSWPRKKEILKTRRNVEKGLADRNSFDQLIEQETARIIKKQDELGLDIIVSGELSRDNYSSFVAEKIKGCSLLSMNEIIDYIEDKDAFEEILATLDVPSISIKNAICTGKLHYSPIALTELIMLKKYTNKPVKITLPGPYLLTRSMWLPELSKNAYSSKEDLGQAVLSILKQEVKTLQDNGVDIIQFDEPVLTEVVFSEGKTRSFMCAALSEKKDPTEELAFARYLIENLLQSLDHQKSLISIHVCRGNWSKDESILLTGTYGPLVPLFENISADMLTLEFATPRAGDIGTLLKSKVIDNNRILGLGVENPRLNEIETADFIISKVEEALKYLPPDRIFLTPDCGFATFANRPVNDEFFINKKISALVNASQILKSRYGG